MIKEKKNLTFSSNVIPASSTAVRILKEGGGIESFKAQLLKLQKESGMLCRKRQVFELHNYKL